MNLRQLIDNILRENDSLCMDSDEDRDYLANELYLHIKHELEERNEITKRFVIMKGKQR